MAQAETVDKYKKTRLDNSHQKSMLQNRTRMCELYGLSFENHFIKHQSQQAAKRKHNAHFAPDYRNVAPKEPLCLSRNCALSAMHAEDVIENKTYEPTPTREQAPWFMGYNNRNPSLCPTESMVKRYGAYGTIKILSQEPLRWASLPAMIGKEDAKFFIGKQIVIDEYNDPLVKPPSLWPKESAYVEGSDLDFKTTRGISAGTTFTLAPELQDLSDFERLQRVDRLQKLEYDKLKAEMIKENEKRRDEMKKTEIRIKETKVKQTKALGKLHLSSYNSPKANIRPLKNYSVIQKKESSTVGHHQRRIQDSNRRKFELKWVYIGKFGQAIRNNYNRAPFLKELDALKQKAFDISMQNFTAYCLNREQFEDFIRHSLPGLAAQDATRLFSAFDPFRTDEVDFREMLGLVRIMRPTSTAGLGCMAELFNAFDAETKGYTTIKNVHKICTICCGSAEEEQEMLRLVKEGFCGNEMDLVNYEDFAAKLQQHPKILQRFEQDLRLRKTEMLTRTTSA